MNWIRRHIVLLLFNVIALLTLMPINVMALPNGGYVPIKATNYYMDTDSGKWKKSYVTTCSYKPDGRLTKFSSNEGGEFITLICNDLCQQQITEMTICY